MTGSSSDPPSGSAASCERRATASSSTAFGPDGVSKAVIETTGKVVKLQTGYIYNYAFTMLIGVAALVTWYL